MPSKIGVGVSTKSDSKRAVLDAVGAAMEEAGLERAGWAVCFFSLAHMPRADLLHEIILRDTGCQAFLGCSGAAVLAGDQELERAPAVAVMVGDTPHLEVRSAVCSDSGEGLAGLVPEKGGDPGGSLVLALPDAYRVDVAAMLDNIYEERPGLPLYGAGASDNGTTGVSLQMGMEGVRSNSVAALGFSGDLEVAVGITQSCSPAGEPHFITAYHDNVIEELDGRQAIQVLMEQGRVLELEDFQEVVDQLLMGFPLDSLNPAFNSESCLVRHLSGFEQQTGSLAVPHDLEGQSSMIFMHRNGEKAEQDMRRMVEDLKQRLAAPPRFGFYFNCSARGRNLYAREGVDTALIREVLGDFPLVGMAGGFEMATNVGLPLLYTYTGVLVLVSTGDE